MKYVDAKEYISMLKELIEEGREVNLIVTGSSMSPFLIHERDAVYLRKPDHELKKGDIVFYERNDGQFILHRILEINDNGTYDIIGDNQDVIEEGVRKDQIFAYVFKVKRKGKIIEPGSFWWDFFAGPWMEMIPARRTVSRLYGTITKKKREKNS
ncbi:MAG: hypothetical protein E7185_00120 [Erysipelotrichaceae bacterium]|nr:hypothetical protein [Erysipelotrichaceae bacterium]